MNQHSCSARSFKEHMVFQVEKDMQPKVQIAELQNQTTALTNIKELTNLNTEYVKQIAELTIENQKSASKQFWASIIIAGAALFVSVVALFIK